MSFFTEEEITHVFTEIDKKQEGKIDKRQFYKGFIKFFPHFKKKTVYSLFSMADKDKSKSLELKEFISLVRFIERKTYDDDPFVILFDQCDLDKNGVLDRDEFLLVWQCIDENVDREMVGQMFDAADADGNGVLDFDEYMELCAHVQSKIAPK